MQHHIQLISFLGLVPRRILDNTKSDDTEDDTEAVGIKSDDTEATANPVYTSPHTGTRANSLKTVGCVWLDKYCLPSEEFVPSLFFAPCPQGCKFIVGHHKSNYMNYRCSCNDNNMVRLTRIDEVGKVNGKYLFDIAMKRANKYRCHLTSDGKPYPMTIKRENQFKTGVMDGQD